MTIHKATTNFYYLKIIDNEIKRKQEWECQNGKS